MGSQKTWLMSSSIFFKASNTLCLKETEENAKIEAHRAGLRKGQRERRKMRMQASINTNMFSFRCD